MMVTESNRLGDLLLEAGLIDSYQLESALSMQRNLGGQIGAALVKLGYLPEATIIEFLQTQQRYARFNLGEAVIDPSLMSLLPVERMRLYQVVPIELRKQGYDKVLHMAMTDPTDTQLIDKLQFATGCKILPMIASAEDILETLSMHNMPDMQEEQQIAELEQPFVGSFTSDSTISDDGRLDRLLEILQEKGILNLVEMERINGDR